MPERGTVPSPSNAQSLPFPAGVDGEALPQSGVASPPERGLAATFRALRHRNYRLYFFGQLVSVTGSWMQTTALMWLAYEMTHQSKWPALVAAAQVLPTFLLGPWGGVLADHWPKRSLIFLTQTIFMILALLLAGLAFSGVITPWQLLLVTTAAGIVQAVDLPARLSFVHDMAGRDDLMNAVALNSLLFNVARILGPALAGPLLTVLGAGWCFLANGLSYLAVLWALGRMDVVGWPRAARSGQGRRLRTAALLAGFTYLSRRAGLVYLVLLAGTLAFFGWPFLALLPALAEHTLEVKEQGYSLMLSSTGGGALAAACVVATFGSLARRRLFLGAGVSLVVSALVGLALSATLPPAMACCALIGFGLILFLVTGQTVVQLSADDFNRGRVMAIWAMVLSGATPLGNLLAGLAADQWSAPKVLLYQGLACAAAAVALFGILRLWKGK